MALSVTENLPLLSLSGNPMKIKIHTDNLFDGLTKRPFYNIIVNIYSSTNTLIRSLSEEPNDSGDAWFNLADAFTELKPELVHPIQPNSPVVSDSLATTKFYVKIAEGYGVPYTEQPESAASGNYYVIPGGLPDWYLRKLVQGNTDFYSQLVLQNIWLTNQPYMKKVFTDQPEQLRFFHLYAATRTASLIVSRLNSNGVTSVHTLWTGNLSPYTMYSVLASPSFCALADTVSYTLYFVVENTKITDEAKFAIETAKPDNTRYILFQNSLGGFDCAALTGKMTTDLETSTNDYVNPEISKIREALVPEQSRALGVKYISGSIGWKDSKEMEWLSELLHSNNRKIVVNATDLENITISADRRKIGDDSNAPKTFNIEAIVGVPDFFFLDLG